MYDALPNATSIRVLDLLEASSTRVRCTMHVVNLETNPAYAALSYTARNPITVHDRRLSDPVALHEVGNPQLPFERSITHPGPAVVPKSFAIVDGARREYYHQTLEHVHNFPYEDVNYPDGPPRVIEVDGCAVQVGENLFRFLASLGELRKQMSEEPLEASELLEARDALRLPIWINAVCVNQEDLEEKAAHVTLARAIFKSALHVFAWVGPSDRLGDRATEAIDIILGYIHAQELRQGDPLGIALDRPLPEEFTMSSILEMTTAHWFALFAFFQRRWFRSAWAAQNIILARQAYMVYGENMVDMSLVVRVLTYLDNRGLGPEFCAFGRAFLTGEPVSDPGRYVTKLLAAANLEGAEPSPASVTEALVVEPKDIFTFIRGFHYIRQHRRPRLTSALSALRDLDTTDPRDKIFAFLGLVDDELGIIPDYGATIQDLYRTATVATIEKRLRLSILSHVQDAQNTNIRDLPSWVPDFSVRLGRVPLDKGTTSECDFRASGESVYRLAANPNGTLGVFAIRIDTVSTVTDMDVDPVSQILKVALGLPAWYPDKPLSWCLVKAGGGSSSEELRPRTVSRVEALWRTLLADNVKAEGYYPGEFADYLGNGFASWVLRDILETRVGIHEHAELEKMHWVRSLGVDSFCSKLALWSAMYDGHQVVAHQELNNIHIPYYERAIGKLYRKRGDEREQYQLDLHLGIPEPTVGILHFPTANRLMECVGDPVDELDAEIAQEHLSGAYRANARSRLTSEERKGAASFEERMRIATEGRSLFRTPRGRIGLGPRSVGKEPGCKDEIWILSGADVPFILRHEKGDRYRVVGEAYVHGIMYGEKLGAPCNWEDIILV
ncbi:uncharacterized protein B0H64DRAFT_319798 [Chaetomium fimeti]|uniref:Heterokaryon incompatibility domain-containing protein n=1 Tax=Chaetomium fimeti TaxID=1854472 RepID=A0AAE0HIG9_9PEZI|nr:hypothetical protein B0H64DRAFT_319798 [Chaetomium fimeti]